MIEPTVQAGHKIKDSVLSHQKKSNSFKECSQTSLRKLNHQALSIILAYLEAYLISNNKIFVKGFFSSGIKLYGTFTGDPYQNRGEHWAKLSD